MAKTKVNHDFLSVPPSGGTYISPILVFVFRAPKEEKYFPEIGKIFSAECYVIGSLPPPRHSWESLEAINRIAPVLEELSAGPFLPDKYDSGSLE